MTKDQYRKFIDATLLAAAVTYFNEQALVAVQNDMQRIINQYKFTPNAPDTDKEFQNNYIEIIKKFKSQPKPDIQTKFYVRRFYKIAI